MGHEDAGMALYLAALRFTLAQDRVATRGLRPLYDQRQEGENHARHPD